MARHKGESPTEFTIILNNRGRREVVTVPRLIFTFNIRYSLYQDLFNNVFSKRSYAHRVTPGFKDRASYQVIFGFESCRSWMNPGPRGQFIYISISRELVYKSSLNRVSYIYANVGFHSSRSIIFQSTCFGSDTVLTVGLLRPRSLGNLSTSCKYHFKGLSGWPPDEARKPMAISNDDKTSQTSDKDERKSMIIWPSMTRDMDSCSKKGNGREKHLEETQYRKLFVYTNVIISYQNNYELK